MTQRELMAGLGRVADRLVGVRADAPTVQPQLGCTVYWRHLRALQEFTSHPVYRVTRAILREAIAV